MDNIAFPLVIVLIVALGAVVAFMFRKVYLWYTGMMELLTELMKQTKILQEIRDELNDRKINDN